MQFIPQLAIMIFPFPPSLPHTCNKYRCGPLTIILSRFLSISLSLPRVLSETTQWRRANIRSQFHAPRPFFPLPPFEWPEIRDCIILLMSTTRWLKNDDTRSVPIASSLLSCLFLDKVSFFLFFYLPGCNSAPHSVCKWWIQREEIRELINSRLTKNQKE